VLFLTVMKRMHADSSDGSEHMRTRHEADIGLGRVGQHAMSSEAESDSAPYEFQPQVCSRRDHHDSAACRHRPRTVNAPPSAPTETSQTTAALCTTYLNLLRSELTVIRSRQEEQLLELVMNGMRVAGLALALEAMSSFVLGAPALAMRAKGPRVLWPQRALDAGYAASWTTLYGICAPIVQICDSD